MPESRAILHIKYTKEEVDTQLTKMVKETMDLKEAKLLDWLWVSGGQMEILIDHMPDV